VTTVGWDVVVPLKEVAHAKTRLTVLGDRWRQTFARAMFLDTVEAVTRCPLPVRVHAVTGDRASITELATFPVQVVLHPDAPPGVNNALRHAVRTSTDQGWGRVALLGDLPSLSGQDLAEVIERSGSAPRSVVPDAEDVGTTMLVVAAGQPLLPSFGPGSLARHVASGAVPVAASAAARRDVDRPEDLWDAWRLGVGPRTAWALERMCGSPDPVGSVRPGLPATA
jgi:2-phospho-L-lactate guanylyltransferase